MILFLKWTQRASLIEVNTAAAQGANENNASENKLELNWASINAIRMGHNYSKYIPELLVNGR